jgi:serine phosphatase RsbU (regulator of sigma subunit)
VTGLALGFEALAEDVGTGRPALTFVDAHGVVVRRCGFDDGATVSRDADTFRVAVPPGRRSIEWPLPAEGLALLTFDATGAEHMEPMFRELLRLAADNQRLEADLDSMDARSAFLLEEWALVIETLPRLPTGETETEIVELALCRLVTAAGVQRAVYVEHVPERNQGYVRGHVVVEVGEREPRPVPYPMELELDDDRVGLFGRALHYGDEAGMHRLTGKENAAIAEEFAASEGPESLARKDLIAVPVRYGNGPDATTLGVLMVMDRNPHGSFQGNSDLDNEERVLTAAVASLLGAVLGVRQSTRLRHELETANQIQLVLRPQQPGRVPGFDLAGACRTFGEVGGDYLDYLPMSGGRLLAVVADVSGHNLASGMLMVTARAALRVLAGRNERVGRVFDELAAALHDDLTRTERFLTAAAIALEPGGREATIANAGHNDTLVFRAATRSVERIGSTDPLLGFLPDLVFGEHRVRLAPGDVLVVYTDGITEATNAAGEMFGDDALDRVLREHAGRTAEGIRKSIFEAVDKFVGRRGYDDDVTVLVVKAVAIAADSEASR